VERKTVIPVSINEIRSFIVETFLFGDGDHIADNTPLLEQHIVDSTGILEIVSFLEDKFGIRIEDHELVPENLNSIENIHKFLQGKQLPLA
jgi:acyl carrier protein